MKIAVCVKYVPVAAQMRFDATTRTLVREGVASELNPFDRLGVACAVALRTRPDDEVVVVSMGPPQSRDGLLQCLALGADRAVLLSDRAFVGSDTLATARALALVLSREQPDLILCGRNSTDAETGQVGPELAELLDLPHISQVRQLSYQAQTRRLLAERVTDTGTQQIICPCPAVVCVTEGVAPERYPLPAEIAAAQSKPLEVLTGAQLSADLSQFGVTGSPTWVDELRPVPAKRRGLVIAAVPPDVAAQQVAEQVREHFQALRTASMGAMGQPAPEVRRYPGPGQQSIWVVAERSGSGLRRVTLEMLGKARALAAVTRSEVAALLLGPREETLIRELIVYGADRVLMLAYTEPGAAQSRAVVQALAAAVRTAVPYAVLFAATAESRDLAARLAARLHLGLTGDAIDLEMDAEGQLVALKPAIGGQVIAPIRSKTRPTLVTLRPGVCDPLVPEAYVRETVEVLPLPTWQGVESTVLAEHHEEHTDAVALTQAQVVLGVGMGLGGPDALPTIQALAATLGASLATTRNVVHSRWLPHHLQVGISGRSIAPRLYLAVGIRGAFNHTVGLQRAGVIVALNRNPRAAIFQAADYGIVGDWQTYLPPLVEALQPLVLDIQEQRSSDIGRRVSEG